MSSFPGKIAPTDDAPASRRNDLAEAIVPGELLGRAALAAESAVPAGQLAPAFRLRDVHGSSYALVDLTERQPLVLSFYRGIWCDFCNAALGALARLDGTIRALGAMHVAIGPPPGDAAQRAQLGAFPMPVLIDRGLRVTSAFGLAISLPDDLHGSYAGFGYAPAGQPGAVKISVPATYVVDQGGTVVLAAIDTDYRHRLDPAQLLSALRGLQRRTW